MISDDGINSRFRSMGMMTQIKEMKAKKLKFLNKMSEKWLFTLGNYRGIPWKKLF